MATTIVSELSLAEIDEAIVSARATLKARMPAEQREAVEDYLDSLLGQRQIMKAANRVHETRVLRAPEHR